MEFSKSKKPVVIREVWEKNLEHEFSLIRSVANKYTYISFDTEFPGDVVHPFLKKHQKFSDLTSDSAYSNLKSNVDALEVIQFGLTLSDQHGNLPSFGTHSCYVWQFNFREFDLDKSLHNPSSIELLKRQGIDFVKNKQLGVCAERFSQLFLLCFGRQREVDYPTNVFTWVTFHGAHDFGYLIKLLTRSKLPNDLTTFLDLMSLFFGPCMYDIKKVMMQLCGLRGGLERTAECLKVDRVAGKTHQAGSDSLLTMQIFMKMKDMYFQGEKINALSQFICMPYGLNLEVSRQVYV